LSLQTGQFGFKKGFSTNYCLFVDQEVVSYYLNNRSDVEVVSYYLNNSSDVFATAHDMQEAFDRVDLIMIFKKLREVISGCYTSFYVYFILTITLCVSWRGAFSDSFVSLNGVKQGGILFPFLFNVFGLRLDDLLVELEDLSVGCNVGSLYYGSIAYADDVLLLALSQNALRVMLNCCTCFATNNNVLFNPTKSHCLHFNRTYASLTQFEVVLQGVQLVWSNSLVHLGHLLTFNKNDSSDLFLRKTNSMLSVITSWLIFLAYLRC
jgi:hypothetical protein